MDWRNSSTINRPSVVEKLYVSQPIPPRLRRLFSQQGACFIVGLTGFSLTDLSSLFATWRGSRFFFIGTRAIFLTDATRRRREAFNHARARVFRHRRLNLKT